MFWIRISQYQILQSAVGPNKNVQYKKGSNVILRRDFSVLNEKAHTSRNIIRFVYEIKKEQDAR